LREELIALLAAQAAEIAALKARITEPEHRLGIALNTFRPRLVERLKCRYDAILAAWLAFHEARPPLAPPQPRRQLTPGGRAPRRTGHNLLLRLFARKLVH
jgi:hypothetical protein